MFVKDLQEKIIKLKKEKDVCILAHSYQAREITEVADIVGDSFMLSKLAAQQPNSTMLMCGVHFMAQTVKMLSPEKKVILANPMATCPMAEQIDLSLGQALRKNVIGRRRFFNFLRGRTLGMLKRLIFSAGFFKGG